MLTNKQKTGWLGMAATWVIFIAVLIALIIATTNLSGGADREGQAATQQAIERAAVLCYATEGFYPPSLSYIEDHYGVQIDRAKYVVRYEVFASNVMPVVRVAGW
ncbi:hypothetical protein LJC49_10685 [Ruminococcaceae bacterium OttesenSCG-928-I18]|nr:hypothetical protein [Ruminococcaceae bacterium OttesenSCG-928-I18]